MTAADLSSNLASDAARESRIDDALALIIAKEGLPEVVRAMCRYFDEHGYEDALAAMLEWLQARRAS